MKRKDAKRVSSLMFKHHDELTGLLRELQAKLSKQEFASLQDAVSRILMISLTNIVNPIVFEHRSLAPKGFVFPWSSGETPKRPRPNKRS